MLDVGVDHSVFGEIRAPVVVETRADIDRHAATIAEAGEAPLSVITGGRHTHTGPCAEPRTRSTPRSVELQRARHPRTQPVQSWQAVRSTAFLTAGSKARLRLR